MFTITTRHTSNASGRSQVIAKGHGKQRTVSVDFARLDEENEAAAVGALLNVLTDARQQSMLRHPSGGQRVRFDYTNPGKVWHIDV